MHNRPGRLSIFWLIELAQCSKNFDMYRLNWLALGVVAYCPIIQRVTTVISDRHCTEHRTAGCESEEKAGLSPDLGGGDRESLVALASHGNAITLSVTEGCSGALARWWRLVVALLLLASKSSRLLIRSFMSLYLARRQSPSNKASSQ